MKILNDIGKINECIRQKQALEIMLAYDLLDIFNEPNGELINWLRTLVRESVSDMDLKRSKSLADFNKYWTGSWKNYECCKSHGINTWDTEFIRRAMLKFTAENCSDWIRIYGEVIENISKGIEDKTRKSYQTGNPEHWEKFDPKKPEDKTTHLRQRTKADQDHPTKPTIIHEMFRFPHSSSGLATWDIAPGNTCGKLDKIFGLCPGATISGTTTDNIYYFDKFGRFQLDEMLYLLPLASLVSCGHHTLLEVALPLSINGIVNYRIGRYTSLFPTKEQHRTNELTEAARKIQLTLHLAECNAFNHLMLLYYTEKSVDPVGCFLFDKNDAADGLRWDALAFAGSTLMNTVKSFPPAPLLENIESLMKREL